MTTNNDPYEHSRIVCAANEYQGTIVLGARHFDMQMHRTIEKLDPAVLPPSPANWRQGFMDQFGNYLTRKEAYVIADRNNQIINSIGYEGDKLYSEHLY